MGGGRGRALVRNFLNIKNYFHEVFFNTEWHTPFIIRPLEKKAPRQICIDNFFFSLQIKPVKYTPAAKQRAPTIELEIIGKRNYRVDNPHWVCVYIVHISLARAPPRSVTRT